MTEIDYEFGSGTDPFGVAAGYLNGGDALLDFAVACSSDTTPNSNGGVAVFVNSTQSPGTFSDPAGFYFSAPDGVFTAPWDVKVADMNQDGKDDLIVSNAAAGSVSVLLARYRSRSCTWGIDSGSS
jgi:hypothetical protein